MEQVGRGKHYKSLGTEQTGLGKHFKSVGAEQPGLGKHYKSLGTERTGLSKHYKSLGTASYGDRSWRDFLSGGDPVWPRPPPMNDPLMILRCLLQTELLIIHPNYLKCRCGAIRNNR